MSLGLIIKCPEGLVLSAESRVTITFTPPNGSAIHNNFDNAKKLLTFNGQHRHTAVITYGLGSFGLRTAHSFMPEFESSLVQSRISVEDFANNLSDFFMRVWGQENMPPPPTYTGEPMIFLVAGFDDNEPYGKVFELSIPHNPKPRLVRSVNDFGVNWGGQREIVDRLILGYDPRLMDILKQEFGLSDQQLLTIQPRIAELQLQVPIQMMALQDCIDLAHFIMRTTISGQELSLGIRGCGGHVDVAVITRTEGLAFIKQKELQTK